MDQIEGGRTRAWTKANLSPIGLHECRHTFASFLIAAGVNAKALSTYMGHSTITMTLDRYGHLMPGNEDEAAVMLRSTSSAQPARTAEGPDENARREVAHADGAGSQAD